MINKIYLLLAVLVLGFGKVEASNTLLLSVSNDKKDGIAYLSWKADVLKDYKYKIERRIGDTVSWSEIANINSIGIDIKYNDSAFICADSVYYRLTQYQDDGLGQWDQKEIDSARTYIEDLELPQYVELTSVSVVENPYGVELRWKLSDSYDTWGYILTREDGGFPIALDTISGRESVEYIDINARLPEVRKYRIRVVDRCRNASINSTPKHIYTADVEYRWCDDSVTVSFDNPEECIDDIDSIFLYAKSDKNSNYTRLLGRKYSKSDIPKFVYPVAQGVNYSFYKVIAKSMVNNYASSNFDSISIELPSVPDYIELNNVSVNKDKSVNLYLFTDTSKEFGYVRMERKEDEIWKEIRKLIKEDLSGADILNDNTANTGNKQYSYRFRLEDVCGKERLQTEVHNTVLLSINKSENNELLFEWNMCKNWEEKGILDSYVLMLKEGDKPERAIGAVAVSYKEKYNLAYTYSSVEEVLNSSFRIKIIANIDNVEEYLRTSYSNTILMSESSAPVFYMPSGFKPNGLTKIYKPIGYFVEGDIAKWYILNRNGKIIFESGDPDKGWDGTYRGKIVDPGVYIYTISISRKGEVTEKKGSITVL